MQKSRHLADLWAEEMLSRYPDFFQRLARYRQDRASQVFWPVWCTIPEGVTRAILDEDAFCWRQTPQHTAALVTTVPRLTAAVTWWRSKCIYRFAQPLFRTLYYQPLGQDEIPTAYLQNMPFSGLFMDAPLTVAGQPTHGAFFYRNCSATTHQPEACFLFLLQSGSTLHCALPLTAPTLDACLQAAYLPAVAPHAAPAQALFPTQAELTGALQLVLYLSSFQADLPAKAIKHLKKVDDAQIPKRAMQWFAGVNASRYLPQYLPQDAVAHWRVMHVTWRKSAEGIAIRWEAPRA